MIDQLMQFLLKIDYQILHWVGQSATPWQDQFFPWVTDFHKTIYFGWIACALVLFCFYKKFSRAGISLFLILLLALAVSDFAGARVKNHYIRPRPFQNLDIQVVQKSPAGSKSFYSNHSSNMFTFASYTSTFFPIAKVPLYLLAVIVSYSRVYNGVHYPTDVLAGSFMGLIWGFFFSALAKRVLNKLRPKKKDADESSSYRS